MSERKVLNKYFPPNFDPSLIPRRKLKDKNNQQVVRLMAPFSMRCNSCGEYIYKGKKFNARKETVEGEDYMGIRIFRFYIKCTLCSTEITFRTDPKNADYLAEHGASRNFESWRDDEAAQAEKAYMPDAGDDDEEEMEKKREAEDAMQIVENAQEDSKREMDIMDALQDIRQRNARNERVGMTGPLASSSSSKSLALTPEQQLRLAEEEEDEILVRQHFSRIASGASATPAPSSAVDLKGKGKAVASGGLDGYGSDSNSEDNSDNDDEEREEEPKVVVDDAVKEEEKVTVVKRKLGGDDESPSLEALLGKKGLAPPPSTTVGGGFGFGAAAAKKRKVGAGVPGLGGLVRKKK